MGGRVEEEGKESVGISVCHGDQDGAEVRVGDGEFSP